MGHELARFDFPGWPDDADLHWIKHGKPRTNQRLLEAVRRAGRIDLFFGYFYSSVVYPETIDHIRRSCGAPTVNFSCNNVHQFDLVREIAPRFDICIVPELAAQNDFKAVGARPLRLQLAANPRVYRPYPEARIYDVTFVGQRYADRAQLLNYLHCGGVNVKAWGAGWQPRKRLDVAQLKAGLALIEDERLDGLQRLIRHSLRGLAPRRFHQGEASYSAGRPQPVLVDNGHQRASVGGPQRPLAALTLQSSVVATQNLATGDKAQLEVGEAKGSPLEDGQSPRSADGANAGYVDTAAVHAPAQTDGIDTSAFGGPRLLQRDLVRAFSQSRLSLGFATAGESHMAARRLTHLRLREFEAPMSGALYLTEHQEELREYFEPGTDLVTYTDRDDLLDKVRYYLAHQELAERVRRAGLERARCEHTWQHRFRALFTELGLA
jgi:hypothetical protein